MGNLYEKKLGCTISFDKNKEKDIIDKIEYLLSRHKLGWFISNLIRIAFDSPYSLESKAELNKLFKEINENDMLLDRKRFFEKLAKEIEEMRHKIDEIYDMSLKMMLLAQFGKQLGLEKKAENTMAAQFILQKQINDLCETLGISTLNNVYASDKVKNVKKYADEVMEYILTAYDNMITEMSLHLSNLIEMKNLIGWAISGSGGQSNMDGVGDKGSAQKDVEGKDDEVKVEKFGKISSSNTTSENKRETKKEAENEIKDEYEDAEEINDDELIDFGNADLEALANFLGETI